MPRAFLITNRRYNITGDTPCRESSPERVVSTAEEQPDSPHSPANLFRSSPSLQSDEGTSFTLATSAIAAILQQVMQRPLTCIANNNNTDEVDVQVEAHVCPECDKRYSTSSNLARHRQTHRSPGDKKARKCPHCSKLYVSMPAYSMHVRTHSQGCACPYCGKCFSRPWLLQGHIRTHTGEKPFQCPVCRKAFADKSNLRAHIQTHSATKPYVCRRCGKAFALKSYLYKHEESSCMRIGQSPNPAGIEA